MSKYIQFLADLAALLSSPQGQAVIKDIEAILGLASAQSSASLGAPLVSDKPLSDAERLRALAAANAALRSVK